MPLKRGTICTAKQIFFNVSVLPSQNSGSAADRDQALHTVIEEMSLNRTECWNSIRLFSMYEKNGGKLKCRKTIFRKIADHFGNDVVLLSSPGKANMLVFATEAAERFQVEDDEMNDISASVIRVAKKIKKECSILKTKRTHYPVEINKDKANVPISQTLLFLLEEISDKLVGTLVH